MSVSTADSERILAEARMALENAMREQGFLDGLKCFARERAAMLRRSRNVDDDYAAHLVADVITDTWSGKLTFDPAVVDVGHHLRWAMRSRSAHAAVRAKRFPHVDLEAKDHPRVREADELDELDERANDTFAATCRLAAEDDEVLRLVGAYEQGVIRRTEVLGLTKLTPHQYDAARHRLARLTENLRSNLRARSANRR